MRRLLALVPVVAALVTPPLADARLPVLKIDSRRAIPNEPKVAATLRMPGYRGGIGIETRGQSSQMFPMKSFAVELRRDASLLGMPEDDDWVLYAPYNDKSLMRNALAYRTARLFGRYAPRTRFVRLRLNGRAHGIYVLMERLELGKRRVRGEALYEMTFRFQAERKSAWFETPILRRPIVWEDPERGDISAKRARALARPVRQAERALYGPGGGWRRRIEASSAVDYALVNELFKCQDAFHASTYMTLHEDGRLRMGPVWDFDISMGNSTYGASRKLRGWMLENHDWAQRLYDDRRFIKRMGRRWRELRTAGLRGKVLRTIDANYSRLRAPARGHFRRWPVLDTVLWPAPTARGSYRAEVRALRSWVSRRIGWLDGRFMR